MRILIYLTYAYSLASAMISPGLYAQTYHRDAASASAACMAVGTNFWFLAPGWSGEKPFISNIPANPYANKVNIWNQTFLDEIDHYASLRFMDWALTNNWDGSSWSARRLPDDPDNFGDATIAGKKGIPGFAYEWMIDLCNRVQADMWICMPFAADDNFFRQCARLVRDKLDPKLKVYLELGNEIWNFQTAQNYAKAQGKTLGLQDPAAPTDDFRTALRWQAYRSAQMWAIWEQEFGTNKSRLINVLAGWSTNSWHTEKSHLAPLFNENGFNPTNTYPEAYAIAPYFGGNGMDGAASNIFDLLRQDISGKRLPNVKSQYDIVKGKFGIDLVAYEGGQHITVNAVNPNRNPEMYKVYTEYFNAVAPYFTMFSHYTNVSTYGAGGCWGAKESTGQSMSTAHKYRAIYDWIKKNTCTTNIPEANFADPVKIYPNPANNEVTIDLMPLVSDFVSAGLRNGLGQMVKTVESRQSESQIVLDVSTLPQGLYYIYINTDQGSIVKKLIIYK